MITNIIILLSIVGSFVEYGHAQNESVSTLNELLGRWYYMGKISIEEYGVVQSCSLIDIQINPFKDPEAYFYHQEIPIIDLPICEHGVPLWPLASHGKLTKKGFVFIRNKNNPTLISTIKKYNNGTELILTDRRFNTSSTISYRLWSKGRQVSDATKAEFKKLAGNRSVDYYSWEHCRKLREETNDKYTLDQHVGQWYAINRMTFDKLEPADPCETMNITAVDYKTQSFVQSFYEYKDGNRYTRNMNGTIDKSDVVTFPPELRLVFPIVRCNNGAEIIVNFNYARDYGVYSRNPQVTAETKSEFEKIVKHYPDANYETYCPNYSLNKMN